MSYSKKQETRSKYVRPPEMEFTKDTILVALYNANWKCEECGIEKKQTPEGYLEIHHKLPIYIALLAYTAISPTLIRSIANAEVLCCTCHHKRHAVENWGEYDTMAKKLNQIAAIDGRALLGSGGRRRI